MVWWGLKCKPDGAARIPLPLWQGDLEIASSLDCRLSGTTAPKYSQGRRDAHLVLVKKVRLLVGPAGRLLGKRL